MKIKQTIERECCNQRSGDLVELHAEGRPCGRHWWFCKWCGRHFGEERQGEPRETVLVPLSWPWEDEEVVRQIKAIRHGG